MAIKSLNEIIKFNNSFKTSINLYLSLNKAEKVLSYIPTKSSVNFLDGYMQATINNKEQATLLVGPYGKGKSHLLLVLLAILSMERTGENTQIIEELADKISAVDELGEQAASDVKLLWSKNRFLPVIINDTTGDLNQAFLLALNDALKREKLVDLAPDTYYSIALNRIEDWQENYPETYHDFITELKSIGIEHKEFIYELKRYSRTALDTFISVYPKITSGSIFNPLAVSEVLPLYKSVSERLVEDYGFSGIYIVFDEFSKFIEGLTDGNVGNNMKLLQDMCELATDSSNAKIFITMIAHKSIKEYGKYLSSDIINAFTGIEGRIVEKHFVTSSKNNYELVSHAIIKNSRALGQIPNAGKIVGPTALENYYQLPVFNCNFERKDFDEIILKGCYPLNPLATYLLLNISEKVAQNERTLFTFISNDEPNSMARYVLDHDKSKDWVIGADLIYDYFSGLFKKDVNNEFIHNIWLGAEVALSKCSSEDERKVIKAMAVIQIVNKEDEVLANETYLSLAVRLKEGTSVLEALTQKNIIYRKKSTGAYVYKTQAGIELRTEIKKLKEIKGNNVNYGKALLDINSAYYVVPRKYNAMHSMTRYFQHEYMEAEYFLNVESAEVFFDSQMKADGKVITLFSRKAIQQDAVIEKVEENAYALQRAEKKGIPNVCVSPKAFASRAEFNQALLDTVDQFQADLLVLAGFLVVIPEMMIEAYRNRIINIHPSLIPAFCGTGYYGLKVHEAALEKGVKVVGATVHFVDEGTDTGAIILQKAVEVKQGDTPEILQRRVMEQAEWKILPQAIDLIANGKVKVVDGKVMIEEEA